MSDRSPIGDEGFKSVANGLTEIETLCLEGYSVLVFGSLTRVLVLPRSCLTIE